MKPNFGGWKYSFLKIPLPPPSRESTVAFFIHGDQALSSSLVLQMSNKEDFKDFEAMAEKKQTFSPSKPVKDWTRKILQYKNQPYWS